MTNPLSYLTSRGRLLALLFLLLLGSTSSAWAVAPFNAFDNVSLQARNEAYVAPSGAGLTDVNALEADEAFSGALPLGFGFKFAGSNYTQVYASSNGFLSFDLLKAAGPNNDLDGIRIPLIAPLWDDLDGTGGTAHYQTTGTAPNRVFTFEWANWQWDKNATAPVISFQCRLFEGSNKIEFAYNRLDGSVSNGTASIGLSGRNNPDRTEYVSLNSTGPNPALAKGRGGSIGNAVQPETANLSAKPESGQVYALVVTPAPANDECTGATTLALGSARSVSSANSTYSTTTPLPSDGTYQGYDVWYTLTVPASGQLRLVGNGGQRTSGGEYVNTVRFNVYSGSCGSLTEVAAATLSDPTNGVSSTNLSGRPAGEVLHLRAWMTENGSGGSVLGTAGTFSLQAVDPITTWTGEVSRDWNTAGNWSTNAVPTAGTDVQIPSTAARQPLISGAVTANNVNLQSGATLELLAVATGTPARLTLTSNLLLANGSTLTQGTRSIVSIEGDLTNNGATLALANDSQLGFDHNVGIDNSVKNHILQGTATTTLPNLVLGQFSIGLDPLTLSVPVRVSRTVALYRGSGLTTGGRLTLLSDANGTAMIIRNGGTGNVTGNVSIQRYIDGANRGLGYRHYSSPVSNATVGSLATSGFSPDISAATAFNSAVDPRLVRPFPNVFSYDETRTASTTAGSALIPFDRGFVVPTSAGTTLIPGRGYDVNIDADATVTFTGPLNPSPVNVDGLTRQPGAASEHTGWHLLGNPFAAPISWSLVVRQNMDAAVYIFQSNSQYRGSYISFVNGMGAGNDNIAIGQGFFVRTTTAGTPGSISFPEAARATTYTNPGFARGKQEARPVVQLDLISADASREAAIAYFEEGATAGFDAEFDAYKMPTSGRASLGLLAGATHLSISGLPATSLRTDQSLPLRVSVPEAGTYRFEAVRLLNLPAGTKAYLLDAQTGVRHDLSSTSAYSFELTAATTTSTRFSLLLTGQQALASAPAALTAQVQVYPNPAHDAFQLELPASLARQTAAMLYNSLGQPVRQYNLAPAGTKAVNGIVAGGCYAPNASGGYGNLSLKGIAPGIYSLQLSTAQGTVSKRLVVE